jgi:hypothetical protein
MQIELLAIDKMNLMAVLAQKAA